MGKNNSGRSFVFFQKGGSHSSAFCFVGMIIHHNNCEFDFGLLILFFKNGFQGGQQVLWPFESWNNDHQFHTFGRKMVRCSNEQ